MVRKSIRFQCDRTGVLTEMKFCRALRNVRHHFQSYWRELSVEAFEAIMMVTPEDDEKIHKMYKR